MKPYRRSPNVIYLGDVDDGGWEVVELRPDVVVYAVRDGLIIPATVCIEAGYPA